MQKRRPHGVSEIDGDAGEQNRERLWRVEGAVACSIYRSYQFILPSVLLFPWKALF